jgi:hydrogenase expression/formation protein HypE
MKAGKISQTIWKRSVYKQLHNVREDILFPPSVEESRTAFYISKEKECQDAFVYTDGVSYGRAKNVGIFAVARALNDLAAWGACPVSLSTRILLTTSVSETRLREMVEHMEYVSQSAGVQITAVNAEVNSCVSHPIIFVTAAGTMKEENVPRPACAGPGQDIVLCGYAGLEGMLRILAERESELVKRFVPAFIRQMKNMEEQILAQKAIEAAREAGAVSVHQIGSGGIFAGLWELGEASRTGMNVDMTKIPIKQETIEVCEYYGLNPYQMTSAGCMLMTAQNGDILVKALEGVGARAVKLGVTTAEKARVITSGEEQRYLERPAPDELMLWWDKYGNTTKS